MADISDIIVVTEKAQSRILNILQAQDGADQYVRVGVVGGGCSGLSYKIDFDSQKENDNIIEFGEAKILIDPKSSIYLKDTVLDFQDGLKGKGFVFTNPNASNTCGCGESFTV